MIAWIHRAIMRNLERHVEAALAQIPPAPSRVRVHPKGCPCQVDARIESAAREVSA